MSRRTVRGYVWFAYPDTLGLDDDTVGDPGHPFATATGDIKPPEEVIFFRRVEARDVGLRNPANPHAHLVMTRTQHHPRLRPGWESDPAVLTDKFSSADGRVKLAKLIQVHRRHAGDLIECEMTIEPAPASAGV